MDGKTYAAASLHALVFDGATDLTGTATVDGTTVALRDIKTMFEIESDVARLNETYFTDKPLTDAHRSSVSSLLTQIESGGLQIAAAPEPRDDGYAQQDLTVAITGDLDLAPGGSKTITLTLSAVPTGDVSVMVRPIDASARYRTHYTAMLGATTAIERSGEAFPIEFLAGATDLTETLTFTATEPALAPTNPITEVWDGKKSFLVEFSKLRGALFTDGKTYASIHGTVSRSDPEYARGQTERIVPAQGVLARGLIAEPGGATSYSSPRTLQMTMTDGRASIDASHEYFNYSGATSQGAMRYQLNFGPLPADVQRKFSRNEVSRLRLDFDDWHLNSAASTIDATFGLATGPGFSTYCQSLDASMPVSTRGSKSVDVGRAEPLDFPSAFVRAAAGQNSSCPHPSLFLDIGLETAVAQTPDRSHTGWNINFSQLEVFVMESLPSLVSARAIAGTYPTGSLMPLTAVYSEPVSDPRLILPTIDGGSMELPTQDAGTSEEHTFFLEVTDPQTVQFTGLWTGATSTGQDRNGVYVSTADRDPVDVSGRGAIAFPGDPTTEIVQTSVDYTQFPATATMGGVTVALAPSGPLRAEAAANQGRVRSVMASVDGVDHLFPLAMNSRGTALTANFPVTSSTTFARKRVELFINDGTEADPEWHALVGTPYYADYDVEAVILLEADNLQIQYPTAWGAPPYAIRADDPIQQLTYTHDKPAATYQSSDQFEWSLLGTESDFGTIASIDPSTGEITPTGAAPGTVVPVLTAKNGPYPDVTVTGAEIHLITDGVPYLRLPGTSGAMSIKRGEDPTLRWVSNVAYLNSTAIPPKATDYLVDLFAGDVSQADMVSRLGETGSLGPIASATVPGECSWTAPPGLVREVSPFGGPTYSFLVRAANPYIPSQMLTTAGTIVVMPPPVTVELSSNADGDAVLDSHGDVRFSWTMTEFDMVYSGGFEFAIARDGVVLPESRIVFSPGTGGALGTFTVAQDGRPADGVGPTGGSFTLAIDPLPASQLKSVYTVSVKSRNAASAPWVYASSVLTSFNQSALQILVDGAMPQGRATVSNADFAAAATSAGLLQAYREDRLSLRSVVSVNYSSDAWRAVADRLAWESSDDSVASLHVRQGPLLKSLAASPGMTLPPATDLPLAGHRDGETTITATHAATGSQVSLDVSVETLTNKLYLFQFSPRVATDVEFTDTRGTVYRLRTDAAGSLAAYVADGIASDVKARSVSDGETYLGTLRATMLVSGERDWTRMEQYPVNRLSLLPAATVKLVLNGPEGPYAGEVLINGGIYKNGAYAAGSQLAPRGQPLTMRSDGRGTVIVDWDTSTLTEDGLGLEAGTAVSYAFEIQVPGNRYRSETVTVDSAVGQAARIPETTATVQFVEARAGTFGVLASQWVIGEGGTVLSTTGARSIGVSDRQREVTLRSTMYTAGLPAPGASLRGWVVDETGTRPASQTSRAIQHPFSTFVVVETDLVINESTLWMPTGERRSLTVKLGYPDGRTMASFNSEVSVANSVGLVLDPTDAVAEVTESMVAGSVAKPEPSGVNKIVQYGLDFLSNIEIGNENLNVLISPTDDPFQFNTLVTTALGSEIEHANLEPGWQVGPHSVFYDPEESVDLSFLPSQKDQIDMARGNYDPDGDMDEAIKDGGTSGLDYSFGMSGYFEGLIVYDVAKAVWRFEVVGGGFEAGGSMSYNWTNNFTVGPVPLTVSLEIGGSLAVNWGAHRLVEQATVDGVTWAWADPARSSVTDHIVGLRVAAYIDAFAGLGFDLGVVGAKIGIFGRIGIEYNNSWLMRPSLASSSDRTRYGNSLRLNGELGIKAEVKFLIFSASATLLSVEFASDLWRWNHWDLISEYWLATTGRNVDGTVAEAQAAARAYASQFALASMGRGVWEVEDRDYLDLAPRTWPRTASLARAARVVRMASAAATETPTAIQTNANPYSAPVAADDGAGFVYLSDLGSTDATRTRAAWAESTSTGYVDHGMIAAGGYGDAQLAFDGDSATGMAAWVRVATGGTSDYAGETAPSDVAAMAQSTEVFASVRADGRWRTQQLTANSAPDIGPAVATTGSRAIVAWRTGLAQGSDVTTVGSYTTIAYRTWDATAGWSPAAEVLYSGSDGPVVGLDVEISPDGTAAVAYTTTSPDGTTEVRYAIVDTDPAAALTPERAGQGLNRVVQAIQATSDDQPDENPRLATATSDGEDLFVLGWHHDDRDLATSQVTSDIRLAAFDSTGALHPDLPESLAATAGGEAPATDFQIVEGAGGRVEDLAIVWPDAEVPDDAAGTGPVAATGSLLGVRLGREGGHVMASAPTVLATAAEGVSLDAYTAWGTNAGSLGLVFVGSRATGQVETVPGTAGEPSASFPVTVAGIYGASGEFANEFEVDSVLPSYRDLAVDADLPVGLTIHNTGTSTIATLRVEFMDPGASQGEVARTLDDFGLAPGASTAVNVFYPVGETIVNPHYRVVADFADGTSHTVDGDLYLTLNDVGVGEVTVIKEADGERDIAVPLYNASAYPLAGSGRTVKLGFFADATVDSPALPTISVSDDATLAAIDAGAYVTTLTEPLDVAEWLDAHGGGSEIPESGIPLYVKAWIEENGNHIRDLGDANNLTRVTFASLTASGPASGVAVDSQMEADGSGTVAQVAVHNLSLAPRTGGSLLVTLVDDAGQPVESRWLSGAVGGIDLGPEQVVEGEVHFAGQGSGIETRYIAEVAEVPYGLASLGMSGIAQEVLVGERTQYAFTTVNLATTTVTARANNPAAIVEVLGDGSVLASGEGTATAMVPIGRASTDGGSQRTEVQVRVTAPGDPRGVAAYEVTVNNRRDDGRVDLRLRSDPVPDGEWIGGSGTGGDPVAVMAWVAGPRVDWSARDLFYQVDDGPPVRVDGFDGWPMTIVSLADGRHRVRAWVSDEAERRLGERTLDLRIDREGPTALESPTVRGSDGTALNQVGSVIVADGRQLEVSGRFADSLSGLAFVNLVADGWIRQPLTLIDGPSGLYRGPVPADIRGPLEVEVGDHAGNVTRFHAGWIAQPARGIVLTPGEDRDFGRAEAGYRQMGGGTVTLVNIGHLATGPLSVQMTGANPTSFAATPVSIADVPPGGRVTLQVAPVTGLAGPSLHTATMEVRGDGVSASLGVRFDVGAPAAGPRDGVDAPATPATVTRLASPLTRLYVAKGTGMRLPIAISGTGNVAKAALTWSSSKPSVATVDSTGRIKAKATGTTTVRVKAASGVSLKLTVKVVSTARDLTSLKAKTGKTMRVGRAARIAVTPRPASATNVTVTFTSSKPSVIAVDKAGRLTAKKPGKATIRVKARGKTVSLPVRAVAG
ncbi:MAG: Ig-like domain-containing protein [Bifidobacteriaceae bacterium]|nr:Ig-like domain-containing protein [Bifidobacteriaceae bacterium]